MSQSRLLVGDRIREQHPQSIGAWGRRLLSEITAQDWMVIFYFHVMILSVVLAPPSLARTQNLQSLSGLLFLLAAVTVSVRGGVITRPHLAAFIHRATVIGTVLGSYFLLQGLLPIVNTAAYDAQLYRLDLWLFGFEPCLWFDRFVTSATTEWFAFFYYSYFFLIALHVLPYSFLGRNTKLFAKFSIGFLAVYCVAHVVYMLVPGYGPFRFLAHEFQTALPMGFWYQRVLEAVNTAGAQKDIFPSLHTAGPTFCFLFSFRHRDTLPFKFTWPITGFFTLNIVIATMFLRWHYVIDIVAGIALAYGALVIGHRIVSKEAARREARGLQPVWGDLWPKRPRALPEREAVSR